MSVRLNAPIGHTMFDTPVVSTLLRWVALLMLSVAGWSTEGQLTREPKYVMIAAPHTSNWDLPFMLAIALVFRARIFWMGKHTLFRRPFGPLFRWLGGVPIDRRQSGNIVAQMIEIFSQHESFGLVVAPSGTRKHTYLWRTGFYHIAAGAGVPIVLGFLDYQRKVGGIGPATWPTGDIEADMAAIRGFYADIAGKYPAATRDLPLVREA